MTNRFPLIPIKELVSKVGTWNPNSSRVNDVINYIDISSIGQQSKLIESVSKIEAQLAPSRARQVVRDGDVIVSTVRPNLNAVARVFSEFDGYVASTGFCVLRPNLSKLISGYLYHWVKTNWFIDNLVSRATGASYPAVTDKIVKNSCIPLPPLPEQRRIAAILDKADAIRRKRQQAIKLADDFLRATFLDMFGKGFIESDKDRWKSIHEISSFIDYRGKTPEKASYGIPLLTAKNVKNGFVDQDPKEYITPETYDLWMTRGFPNERDILFTTEAPLGNAALLPQYNKVAFAQRILIIHPYDEILPEFLCFALREPVIQKDINQRATGSTVKGIRSKELGQVKIPIPTIKSQERFRKIYWGATGAKDELKKASSNSSLLFDSLTQRAFRGEL